MPLYPSNEEFVRDLKDHARHEMASIAEQDNLENLSTKEQNLTRSRAAMLSLISRLARHSVPMLSLVAISIAVIAGFYTISTSALTLPLVGRLFYWLVLAAGALFFTAHRLRLFRQGLAYNGRPFTWRAHYTCTMAVLSTALGAAAFLLTPMSLSPIAVLMICGVLVLLSLALGLGHLSHLVTSLAACLPCLSLALTAPLAHISAMPQHIQEGALALFAGTAALLLLAIGWASAQYKLIVANALAAHPRHEMMQVSARQKKISAAYNPFSFRLQQQKPASDLPYNLSSDR